MNTLCFYELLVVFLLDDVLALEVLLLLVHQRTAEVYLALPLPTLHQRQVTLHVLPETLLSHDLNFRIRTLPTVFYSLAAHEHLLELVGSELDVQMFLLRQVFVDNALEYGAPWLLALDVDPLVGADFVENLGRQVQPTAPPVVIVGLLVLESVQTLPQLLLPAVFGNIGRLGVGIVGVDLLVYLLDSVF